MASLKLLSNGQTKCKESALAGGGSPVYQGRWEDVPGKLPLSQIWKKSSSDIGRDKGISNWWKQSRISKVARQSQRPWGKGLLLGGFRERWHYAETSEGREVGRGTEKGASQTLCQLGNSTQACSLLLLRSCLYMEIRDWLASACTFNFWNWRPEESHVFWAPLYLRIMLMGSQWDRWRMPLLCGTEQVWDPNNSSSH